MVRTQIKRRRVLIINCYLDETRRLKGRPHFVPQAMTPAYLAGAFNRDLTDLKIYSELHSGPLEDEALMGWPDMLVLTGMTTAYDRMKHMSAYARTKNPKVVVVAGGPGVRALPKKSREYFDYCCNDDVDGLPNVIREVFGAEYADDRVYPRYDLMNWMGIVGYVESSQNCNFKCSFCSLTGEGNSYKTYELEYLAHQLETVGWHTCILFLDNNFYGSDRNYFLAKLDMLKHYWKKKYFGGWAALVTSDFFAKDENLRLAKESGCMALFSGVESFSPEQLMSYRKKQNLILPQVETIKNCLDSGIVFQYGIIFDTTRRTVAEIHEEIDFMVSTPEITLPAFMNLTIPILRTPYFYDCLEQNVILPDTKLRDMDGNTVVLQPRDSIDQVVQFLQDMPSLIGYKKKVMRHVLNFAKRYRKILTTKQMLSAVGNGALLCLPAIAHNHGGLFKFKSQKESRTYVTGSEPVGPLYSPYFRVDESYRHYFEPTLITDSEGRLHPDVSEDLEPMQKTRALSRKANPNEVDAEPVIVE